jgi:hypothetical protein
MNEYQHHFPSNGNLQSLTARLIHHYIIKQDEIFINIAVTLVVANAPQIQQTATY